MSVTDAPVTGPRRLSVPRRVAVTADGRRSAASTVDGREVDAVRESWLVEDRWWTDRPLRRRYWEVVTTCGRDEVVFQRSCEREVVAPAVSHGPLRRHREIPSAPTPRPCPRLCIAVAMSQPPALDPGPTAVGTWSGGRFMRFGEPLDDERFISLITPDDSIRTVITADVYGAGEADRMLGRGDRRPGPRAMCVVGAVGHDFYTGERDGPRAFRASPTPRLRDESEYADYLRMATERSLERCGIDSFDLLLLHNPDRIGYTSEAVWKGMAALRDAGSRA